MLFYEKLEKGQKLEKSVFETIKELGYEVIMTDQRPGSPERQKYHLCDVVILDRLWGIECKLSTEKYKKCKEHNGWDGDFNTPLNESSIMEYNRADFPIYLLNINVFCRKAFWIKVSDLPKCRHDMGIKKGGERVINYDSSSWNSYEGDFNIRDIIKDILDDRYFTDSGYSSYSS